MNAGLLIESKMRWKSRALNCLAEKSVVSCKLLDGSPPSTPGVGALEQGACLHEQIDGYDCGCKRGYVSRGHGWAYSQPYTSSDVTCTYFHSVMMITA